MGRYEYYRFWLFLFGFMAGLTLFTSIYFLASKDLLAGAISGGACLAMCFAGYALGKEWC